MKTIFTKGSSTVIVVILTVVVTLFSFTSCFSKKNKIEKKELCYRQNAQQTYFLLQEQNNKKDSAIKNFIKTLSLEEKLSQIFLINLENDDKFLPVEWYYKEQKEPDGSITKIKKTLIPSGYIFFGYNISKDPKQIIEFTNSVKQYAVLENLILPFLSIDVEGGFVNRLRGVAGPLVENEKVSQCLTPSKAFELYSSYAIQLDSLGFNLNLAPVAEICTAENSDFLSGRSYGTSQDVKVYASKAVNAYQLNNIATVLKHFPGNTNVDPHIGLPKMEMEIQDFNIIKETFSYILEQKPEGVLMSHIIIPSFDNVPACLSKLWITKILRNELNYDGIIFSDDIFMGALIDNGYAPDVASKMAIEAGINCIMISEKKFGHWMQVLKQICLDDLEFLEKIDDSVFKILKYKLKYNMIDYFYDKEKSQYFIQLKKIEDFDFSKNSIEYRLKRFYDNKEKTTQIYNEYFVGQEK